jgi:hypothetical protein
MGLSTKELEDGIKPIDSSRLKTREPHILLWALIAVMSPVFAWFTLRQGYSLKSRVIAFSWLGIMMFIVMNQPSQQDPNVRYVTNQPVKELVYKHPDLPKDQLKIINDLIGKGMIRVELEGNHVFIAPILWRGMPVQSKENFAVLMAKYCGWKHNKDLDYVYIMDNMSGKELAEYDGFGFKNRSDF